MPNTSDGRKAVVLVPKATYWVLPKEFKVAIISLARSLPLVSACESDTSRSSANTPTSPSPSFVGFCTPDKFGICASCFFVFFFLTKTAVAVSSHFVASPAMISHLTSTITMVPQDLDARVFLALNNAIAVDPENLHQYISKVIPIIPANGIYISRSSVIHMLLSGTSPAFASPAAVGELAKQVFAEDVNESELSELEIVEDLEEVAQWLEQVGSTEIIPENMQIESAGAQLEHLKLSSSQFGFTAVEPLAFVQAKLNYVASYLGDVASYLPFLETMAVFDDVSLWISGVVAPFTYFWANYGSLREDSDTCVQYFSVQAFQSQFGILLSALDESSTTSGTKLLPGNYLPVTIVPLAYYYGASLEPLTDWLFKDSRFGKSSSKTLSASNVIQSLELWSDCMDSIYGRNDENASSSLVAACFYIGTSEESFTSVETFEIYEKLEVLSRSLTQVGGHPAAALPQLHRADSFSQFLKLNKYPWADFLGTLQQGIAACCRLFPLSGITLTRFLELQKSDIPIKQKEVLKIMNNVDASTYTTLQENISFFTSQFDFQLTEDTCLMLMDKLLQVHLFDFAVDFAEQNQLNENAVARLVDRKFNAFIDLATNLDDKIGRLKSAAECLLLVDQHKNYELLDDENRQSLARNKHLLKAFLNLKNFRLVLVKNEPVTPKQILAKLADSKTAAPTSLSIISHVLEQNPKSYLAFEKLYRVAVDLAIYTDTDSLNLLPKTQAACIESALVDSNFDFAYKHTKMLLEYHAQQSGSDEQLSRQWLTFYQVGKFVLPEWFNDYDEKVHVQKLDILKRQREVLTLALKLIKPSAGSVDNSRLFIGQLKRLSQEITIWYQEEGDHSGENVKRAARSTQTQIQASLGGVISDVAHTRDQASKKIGKLLASGLGWALGAKEVS